eukprot:1195911-Prorocentrum_minimum.AAC.5
MSDSSAQTAEIPFIFSRQSSPLVSPYTLHLLSFTFFTSAVGSPSRSHPGRPSYKFTPGKRAAVVCDSQHPIPCLFRGAQREADKHRRPHRVSVPVRWSSPCRF